MATPSASSGCSPTRSAATRQPTATSARPGARTQASGRTRSSRTAASSTHTCSSTVRRRATLERANDLVGQALETAYDLDMRALVDRALALRVRLQGIDTADVGSSIDAVASVVEEERPDLRGHTAPDGTVTILFSDIEGSTELNERLGDRAVFEVLREHNEIVRDAVARARRLRGEVAGRRLHARVRQPARRRRVLGRDPARAGGARWTPARASRSACAWACTPARRSASATTSSAATWWSPRASPPRRAAARSWCRRRSRARRGAAEDVAFGEPRELGLKGLSGTHTVHPVEWEAEPAAAAG